MPEFQASHFFILKILQCRIFTAVLIGIANLFRNYLYQEYITIGILFQYKNNHTPKALETKELMWGMRSAARGEIQTAFFFHSRSQSGENFSVNII